MFVFCQGTAKDNVEEESEDEDKLEKESEDKDKLEKESEDKVKLEKESEDEDKLEKEYEDEDKPEKESENNKVDVKSKQGCSSKSLELTQYVTFPRSPFPSPISPSLWRVPYPSPPLPCGAPLRGFFVAYCASPIPPPPDHKVS